MRVDQKQAVFRVGRRRGFRHAVALRAAVTEAHLVMASAGLMAEERARLAHTVKGVERRLAELERALAEMPVEPPVDAAVVYSPWARD